MEMDSKLTPAEKLECIIECIRILTQSLQSALDDEKLDQDVILHLMMYLILKACPTRIHSNLKYKTFENIYLFFFSFIKLLRSTEKMVMEAGNSFSQVFNAVEKIEKFDADFFNMTEDEMKT